MELAGGARIVAERTPAAQEAAILDPLYRSTDEWGGRRHGLGHTLDHTLGPWGMFPYGALLPPTGSLPAAPHIRLSWRERRRRTERMTLHTHHDEQHFVHRINWLRAGVLGANDGIVSTGSLVVGIAAAAADRETLLIAGVAGLVAGAMSMAAGEYVSVSSQTDTERADLAAERLALDAEPEAEREELAQIYAARGVEIRLAREVASQLMDHDDLAAHARDELGISGTIRSRPVQAALTSASAFAIGAFLPLAAVALAPHGRAILVVALASLLSLALLGALSARIGGAGVARAVARVTVWGALAMALTATIGAVFGAMI